MSMNSRWVYPLVCVVSVLSGVLIFQFTLDESESSGIVSHAGTQSEPHINPYSDSVSQSEANTEEIADNPKIKMESVPLIATDGSQTSIGAFEQPLLVVNFWAPWCAPCRDEIPDFIALQDKYSDQLQIIGLAADSAENVVEFEEDFKMNYPSYLTDTLMPVYMMVFENQKSVLPFTAILDANRDLVLAHQGEINLAELEKALAPYLN